MSIKQRINAIERKTGVGNELLIVFLRRLSSEDAILPEYIKAVIIGSSPENCVDVFMRNGETSVAFEARVEELKRPIRGVPDWLRALEAFISDTPYPEGYQLPDLCCWGYSRRGIWLG